MNNLPIETYESVVQQRDALEKKLADMAAENTALNKFIKDDCWVWDDKNETYFDACDCIPETPATDAFTRELMAKGAESGAEHFRSRARCARGLGHHDRACFLDTTAEMFDEYAESLRKGINDAQ
ncbi:hypothetical protein [Hafnia paralvei]|uniref:hypothetical protein n=1 Tax=Hafnia paralvei TaxID=546367 RepID=UPI00214B37DA|nr:hypothetical protein [Hafnia paralvei]